MAYMMHSQRKATIGSSSASSMENPQPHPQHRRGSRLLMLILGIGLLLFLTWAGKTWWEQEQKLAKMEANLAELEQKVQQAKREQEELLLEKERLHDLEYIAEIARRDYFLSREGETLFKVVE